MASCRKQVWAKIVKVKVNGADSHRNLAEVRPWGLKGGQWDLFTALTGAGAGMWLLGFWVATTFSGLACRKPWLSRLLSSLIPGKVKPEEPRAPLV